MAPTRFPAWKGKNAGGNLCGFLGVGVIISIDFVLFTDILARIHSIVYTILTYKIYFGMHSDMSRL